MERIIKLEREDILDALCFLRDCSLKDLEFESQLENFWDIYYYIKDLEKENIKLKKLLEQFKQRTK